MCDDTGEIMSQRVAIIGTGQTVHSSRRDDLSQWELINEACTKALSDAQISVKEVDAVVLTNMEVFEGRALPDMWLSEAVGECLKPSMKIATGGTSGTSGVIAGFHQVASGIFDVVLVVGWEKHSEGHTQTGMSLTEPFWDRTVASGAIGNFALSISQYMIERNVTPYHAALVAVKARKNALNNPYAHLKLEITVESVMNSKMLAYPVRMLDMCPQSDGACALVLASEKFASRCKRPAWVKSAVTRHEQPYIGDQVSRLTTARTLRDAAKESYKRVGINNPLKEIDVAEIYEPVSYAELAWYEALGFCEEGKSGELIESGATEMEGELPVNPSGGVLSTNPVGASGVIRAAEAALQIHQKAEKRQVDGVRTALVHGYGVYAWSDVIILSSNKD